MEIIPTEQEIRAWLLGTIRHVQHIEFYLNELQLGDKDPQRPHDIIGKGNKFEWKVIKGFSVQYRDRSQEFFDTYVQPARERHHCQYHHIKWNEPNPTATPDDMKLGAVDAVCSLTEPDRQYQGGRHTHKEIEEIITRNPIHRQAWLREIHSEMRKIQQPSIEEIVSLRDFPNVGMPKNSYDILKGRVEDTLLMLRDRSYHF